MRKMDLTERIKSFDSGGQVDLTEGRARQSPRTRETEPWRTSVASFSLCDCVERSPQIQAINRRLERRQISVMKLLILLASFGFAYGLPIYLEKSLCTNESPCFTEKTNCTENRPCSTLIVVSNGEYIIDGQGLTGNEFIAVRVSQDSEGLNHYLLCLPGSRTALRAVSNAGLPLIFVESKPSDSFLAEFKACSFGRSVSADFSALQVIKGNLTDDMMMGNGSPLIQQNEGRSFLVKKNPSLAHYLENRGSMPMRRLQISGLVSDVDDRIGLRRTFSEEDSDRIGDFIRDVEDVVESFDDMKNQPVNRRFKAAPKPTIIPDEEELVYDDEYEDLPPIDEDELVLMPKKSVKVEEEDEEKPKKKVVVSRNRGRISHDNDEEKVEKPRKKDRSNVVDKEDDEGLEDVDEVPKKPKKGRGRNTVGDGENEDNVEDVTKKPKKGKGRKLVEDEDEEDRPSKKNKKDKDGSEKEEKWFGDDYYDDNNADYSSYALVIFISLYTLYDLLK
ncbi:unnamed protein product [Caenorhabditis auriculariae]|uniref:Uncharacterized protein n=1 Tax=Caenorhabditis auriculariae TaxID=2777116 RepID=A0A8S1H512_9PELO|nr:unnamed protein product [Caenorhabditis auriculariae]